MPPEEKRNEEKRNAGCLATIFGVRYVVFFIPFMWLWEKLSGEDKKNIWPAIIFIILAVSAAVLIIFSVFTGLIIYL